MDNDETYDETHMLSLIFDELLKEVIEIKPASPLQYISDCFQSLQLKRSEQSFDSSNIKLLIKEICEELQDQAPPLLNQNMQAFSNLKLSTRKRLRPELDSSSENGNGYRVSSGVGLSTILNEIKEPETLGSFKNISPSFPPSFNRARRGSVSAESIQPSEFTFSSVVIPKSFEAKARIASATNTNLLFRNLEDEQKREIVDAMFEKSVACGQDIIKQGEEGDNFYVVDRGSFDIYVNCKKVVEINEGGSFGELALMYNTPRAATVKATTDSVLWAVDRVTFRRIITSNTFRKRRLYESFLRTVPLLKSLQINEIAKISDALEPVTFESNDVIIEQGSLGDYFYMIESGEVQVQKTDSNGIEIPLPGLKAGDYFGELALLNDSPRAATVIAATDLKVVALSKDAFVRLLGPVVDILKRNISNYAAFSCQVKPTNGSRPH